MTGSGKTLSFLVPVLEMLWREKWSASQGLGALVITPTRELAYQIYEVLKKVRNCSSRSSSSPAVSLRRLPDHSLCNLNIVYPNIQQIGCKHDFSAGLVIGGKSIDEERGRLARTNIVIATPGRLLQHMDQTASFSCDLLQMLGRK